jgi:hypothetical protein
MAVGGLPLIAAKFGAEKLEKVFKKHPHLRHKHNS